MTITMSTNILPSALSGDGPELAKEELQEYVNLGIFARIDNHKEHYAIQPCWILDPASGVMEEINRRVLGKWSNKLNAYVVAVKNIKNFDSSAGMNEDHRWLHLDVSATYYTFSPEEGQQLKGEIKKIGHRAAICAIFDVFTVTVFAENDTELSTWNMGDELRFQIYSIIHRRKGPIIRAKSLTKVGGSGKQGKRPASAIENWEEDEEPEQVNGTFDNSLNETADFEEESQVSGKKKKKKKIKIKQEVVEDWEETNSNEMNDHEQPTGTNHDDSIEHEEAHSSKKKKKKKKTSRNE